MGLWKKILVTILVFLIFGFVIYYLTMISNRGQPLFLVFLPLIVTSGFYIKKWNFFPSIIGALFLLILSILYYGQQFFDMIYASLLNLLIFFVLFSVISILIGHVNVSYEELRKERNKEIINRKEAEENKEFLHSLLRHDVRNKLQVVRGYLELFDDFDLPEEAEEYLSLTRDGLEGGIEIIQKVRTLREAQEEGIKEVEIDSVISDAVDEVRGLTEGNDVEFDVECSGGCKVLAGSLLDRVFSNIFENAVQHSDCSKIRVREVMGEDEVNCKIEDNGKGIPDGKKDRIFDRGYTTDEERGLGLGMFLVEVLLETYAGSVEVKDSELGGARFDVYLQKA